MTSNPMPLADYQARQCLCGHMIVREHVNGRCTVDGCGCVEARDRGDGPTVPVPDTRDPNRPF